MSEMNFELLQDNIRGLLEKNGLTQNALADIAGMSQSNVSKALSSKESKQFTLEQVYRIARHFGVSIDELTGNKAAERATVSPRSVMKFLIELLKTDTARVIPWSKSEEVFAVDYDWDGPSCDRSFQDIEYPAIYFPSYAEFDVSGLDREEAQRVYDEFTQCGNDTAFLKMNETINKLLPIIELYKKKEFPEEAFQMVVDGYLKQLRK